jgi:hypothetical protein
MVKASTKKFVRRVKVALVKRDQTLAGWARENGYQKNTVHQAVRGLRNGKLSQLIRTQLEDLINA